MAKLVYMLCGLLFTQKLWAEPLILPKIAEGIPLGSALSYLEDPTLKLDLEAVQAVESWKQATQVVPNFGFSRSAFWGRFTLRNMDTTAHNLFLEYRYPNVDFIEFFEADGQGGWKRVQDGDQTPSHLREIPYRLPTFRMNVAPGDNTYYVRIHTEGACQLPIHIWTPEPYHNKRVSESAFLALLYGFLVVMVLYNGFLAISMRSWSHVVYVLFILNSLVHFLGIQGHFTLLLPEKFVPWMANQGFVTTAGCSVMLACLFSREFLNLRLYSKKLDKVLLFAASVGLAVMIVTQFSYGLGSRLSVLSGVIATTTVLTSSAYCMLKKFRPAYFFTLAWSVSIVGYFFYMLSTAGLIGVNALSSWGPFIGVSVEVVLISLALGDKMRLQQELSEQKIRDLNENLEKIVVEKTRDIRSILAHIKLGILSIVGQNLVIDKEYSASMEGILEERQLEGKPALDLLFRDAALPADILSTMENGLRASIGEDEVAMEANRDCFVNQVRLMKNGREKILELDWNPMPSQDKTTEKVLVTLRDVTEIHEYQQAMQVQRKELEHISELINVHPDQAGRFFAAGRRFLEENKILVGQKRPSADVLKLMFVNMHTLKGSARSLGLKDIAALCHDVEQNLSALQKNLARWDHGQLIGDQLRLERLILSYEDINNNKLNRSKSQQNVEVAREEFMEAIRAFDRIDQLADLVDIRKAICHLRFQAINHVFEKSREIMDELVKPVVKLAKDLDKETPRVSMELLDVGFDKEASTAIRNAMVHVLRNAMDHGLEMPHERIAAGKAAEGEITISMRDDGDAMCVIIRDDGRGLALRTIEQIAIIRSIIPREHRLSHHQIGSLIFEPCFTTSKVVTDLSGRGVGMDAVRCHMQELGGQAVLLLDNPGFGPLPEYAPFRLMLKVPEKYFRRLYTVGEQQKSA